jgi:hypothetical protein
MTTRAPRPAAYSGGKPAAAADAARSRPDPIAVSPAFGPVPPVYVPRTRAEAAAASLLWRPAVRAARLAGGRAVGYLDRAYHALAGRR